MRLSDRDSTRELAAKLSKGDEVALPADCWLPDGRLHIGNVEKLIGQLATEIVALVTDAKAQSDRTAAAFDYVRFNTGDTQYLRNAEEIDVGNMDKDGNWIRRDNGK